MKKRKDLNNVPEYIERTILRPAAETIAFEMQLEEEYIDSKVDRVELRESGLCYVKIIFYDEDFDEIEYETFIDYGPLD